jgi:exosome complex component CSL4
MSQQSEIALPGDSLGALAKFTPGTGTYVHNGEILAATAGRAQITTSRDPTSKSRSIQTISVVQQNLATESNTTTPEKASTTSSSTPRLPTVGTTVYARITAVARQQALCSILALQQEPGVSSVTACAWPFRGILRSQDVRMTEKDRVKMQASVAVGDIIRAEVVSLGDQSGYYLSTAGNELGVVLAWSKNRNICVPISWKEVADEVTGKREERKVAKPI